MPGSRPRIDEVTMGALVLLVAWTAVSGRADEGWPEFRGPRGDGSSLSRELPIRWAEKEEALATGKQATRENVRWKTAIHGRGWSSPVVLGEQIWLTTATEDGKKLFGICVDRATGKVLHDLKVFDVESPGEIHVTNSYASPTPVVEPGRVYLSFGSYGTACLDTRTAEVLWQRRDLPCDHWRGPGSSPILYRVPRSDRPAPAERAAGAEDARSFYICHYDGFDHQYVVALDSRTGDTVWKTDRANDYGTDDGDFKKAYSTPIVITREGRDQLVSAGSRAVFAYEPTSGAEIWRISFERFSSTARPLYFADADLVIANTGFGKGELVAVRPDGKGDVTETHIRWWLRRGVGSKTSSLLVDGLVYSVVDRGGIVSAVEAKTGEEVWTDRLGGNFSASPIVANGFLYFPDEDGKTHVLRAGRSYDPVSVNELADGCMASPAASGRVIYLRTRTHLYALEAHEAHEQKAKD